MTRATAHPNHNFISSEDIHGTEVYGVGNKNIGEIDHLIIDKTSGRVAYVVHEFRWVYGPQPQSLPDPVECFALRHGA